MEYIPLSAILFVLSQTVLSSKNIHGGGGREANNFPFKLSRFRDSTVYTFLYSLHKTVWLKYIYKVNIPLFYFELFKMTLGTVL